MLSARSWSRRLQGRERDRKNYGLPPR